MPQAKFAKKTFCCDTGFYGITFIFPLNFQDKNKYFSHFSKIQNQWLFKHLNFDKMQNVNYLMNNKLSDL